MRIIENDLFIKVFYKNLAAVKPKIATIILILITIVIIMIINTFD